MPDQPAEVGQTDNGGHERELPVVSAGGFANTKADQGDNCRDICRAYQCLLVDVLPALVNRITCDRSFSYGIAASDRAQPSTSRFAAAVTRADARYELVMVLLSDRA